LGEDYSLHGLMRYALMFLLIWWAWLGHTMYSTRFDADDVVQRLLTLLQIFATAAMAANSKAAFDSRDSAGFVADTQYCVLFLSFNISAPPVDRIFPSDVFRDWSRRRDIPNYVCVRTARPDENPNG